MLECIFCHENKVEEVSLICDDCKLSQIPRMIVDYEIEKLIELDVIKIRPVLDMDEQLSPFGFDLTLDTKFKRVIKSNNVSIDPIEKVSDDRYYENRELLLGKIDDVYILHPGEFALGQSFEYVSLPPFIGGGLDGKSSLGRLGVTVHTTAASVDPGFKGHLTFELFNTGSLPVILRPLQSVARLVFHVTNKVKKPYAGKYIAQTEVRGSRYFESYFSKKLNNRKFIP